MAEISVIIPCYNQEKYIAECLASVLAQDFSAWEAIVVNDGSTDNSLAIIKSYATKYPKKIKIINQKNQGVIVARNNAIAQAEGRYIFPLDGDDKIRPDCLSKLYEAMRAKKGEVICCYVRKFGQENDLMRNEKVSYWTMCSQNQVCVSALYRKEDWQKYGGYDPKMKDGLEDWDFWLNFVEDGKNFYCVPEELFLYRIVKSSRNSSVSTKKIKKNIYKKHRKIYAFELIKKLIRFFYCRKMKNNKLQIKICKIPVFNKHYLFLENTKPILVHVHIYYPEMWYELRQCIQNIVPHSFDLYVTMVEEHQDIITDIKDNFPSAKIQVVENRGYDIYPFIKILNNLDMDDYSYVIHLHTKRDMPDGVVFRGLRKDGWRKCLLDFIATHKSFENCLDFFAHHPKCGMLTSYRLICFKRYFDDDLQKQYSEFMRRYNFKDIKYAFCAGTMWMVRANILKSIQNLKLQANDFPIAQNLRKSQLAHVLERIFGFMVKKQGYKIYDGNLSVGKFKMLMLKQIYKEKYRPIVKKVLRFFFCKKNTASNKIVIKVCNISVCNLPRKELL